MATSAICGSGGVVTVTGVTEVTKWEITRTVDSIPATSFSSNGWVEKVACLTGATGSFTSIGGPSAVGAGTGTFKTKSTGGISIAGSIIVTKVTINTPVDGIVSFDHDFTFTGTVTVGT